MTVDEILGRLEKVKRHTSETSGVYWMARCTAHDDHNPSLSISEGADGRILLKCHAGCATESVLAALGLQARDLFAEANGNGGNGNGAEWTPHGPVVAIYDYVDEAGALLFQVCKTADKQFSQRVPDSTTKSGWRWKLGETRRVLYRLPDVLEAASLGETIYVVEGEKDALAVENANGWATCNPMGAGKWRSEYAKALGGATVVIVAAGTHPASPTLGRSHRPSRARTTTIVRALTGKDVSDHLAGGHTLAELVVIDPGDDDDAAHLLAPPDEPLPPARGLSQTRPGRRSNGSG